MHADSSRTAGRALLALCALLVALAALHAGGGRARADHPGPGAFWGLPPQGDAVGVVVTTETASPGALVAALRAAGCDPMSIAAVARGQLRAYVPGAPAFVNARFPSVVAGGTQVALRCREQLPAAVDPENAAYVVEGEELRLAGGRLEVPFEPGSASTTVTELGSHRSYGDLDGDGALDAAAALVQNAGGSGTFHYLAVSPGGPGGPGPTVFLGDRVWVERVAIAHGRVSVSYLDRGFSDPMASAPTIPVSRQFALEQGALVELGSGACEAPALADAGSFVIVTAPASGSEVLGRFTVSGCSRTFESNVNWRLLDRGGAELAAGHAAGGGVDGPGRFLFTVEYDVAERQIGRLEVFEVDASEGEGLPPPLETITLILR
ncbi:MAG: hypothetical protein OXC94_08695 [Chloroflexi bacterium]|nr:hypothetical protein [Chloroflexota bacterium]